MGDSLAQFRRGSSVLGLGATLDAIKCSGKPSLHAGRNGL
jgi:hypothetical protein